MTTIYEVLGGGDGLRRLTAAHHRRCLDDPELSHAFRDTDHDPHVERLAAYWGEVLGGPPTYSRTVGDHSSVLELHARMGADEDFHQRFLACFVAAFDDVGVPADPALRGALTAYMAAAVEEFHHYQPRDAVVPAGLPVPRWTWGGPVVSRPGNVVFDAADPERLAGFWAALTGYVPRQLFDPYVGLKDPTGRGPNLTFQRAAPPGGCHVDLYVDDPDAAAARAEQLGGRRVRAVEEGDTRWVVVADPEGNEVCFVAAIGPERRP